MMEDVWPTGENWWEFGDIPMGFDGEIIKFSLDGIIMIKNHIKY